MSNEPDKIIYSMIRVSKRHGQKEVLKDISLSYFYGAKIGVLGLNGAGKSSLLKILAGVDEAFDGKTVLAPGYTIGYLEQEPLAGETRTVREVVEEGVSELMAIAKEFEEINARFAEPMEPEEMDALIERQAQVEELMDHKGVWDLDARLEMAMDALRCPPADMTVDKISGGERRRVALCRLLLQAPDILLLDEPTNHLDAESVAWLERYLSTFPGTVIAVTHDRYFLDNVAEWICEVDRGTLYPYKGNYSTYLETKSARLEMESKQNAKRAKKMRDELAWVRSSQKARQAKSKARLAAYEEMEAAAARAEKVDYTDIHLPVGPRLGNKVLEASHLHKAFGDRVLIDDLSFSLPRNGIVGVIGPNGVGKSTLFKMIVGQEPVTSGSLELGETVKLSYVDQNREGLDPQKTVWEVVSGGNDYITVGRQEIPSRAYVSAFGFKGTDQQKRAGVLSGGERNRLNLALTLRQGGNLVLLDEPTNDLDTETLESLEEALLEFPGCCVITSHDRWFMDRICTHILAWEGTDEDPGAWHWFEGNFEDYQKDRVKRLGPDLSKPHRLHRKLTRD